MNLGDLCTQYRSLFFFNGTSCKLCSIHMVRFLSKAYVFGIIIRIKLPFFFLNDYWYSEGEQCFISSLVYELKWFTESCNTFETFPVRLKL